MRVEMFSGGSKVTVYGRNLDSVAEPRITVTVVTNTTNNDGNTSSTTDSNSGVLSLYYTSVGGRGQPGYKGY